ncbi:hypothetical protein BGW80DRAFT_1256299 [Lactifluus volemus]|nr:hypothetical protein BGW80DRAFT_1256299 [Lactifluus volemus]
MEQELAQQVEHREMCVWGGYGETMTNNRQRHMGLVHYEIKRNEVKTISPKESGVSETVWYMFMPAAISHVMGPILLADVDPLQRARGMIGSKSDPAASLGRVPTKGSAATLQTHHECLKSKKTLGRAWPPGPIGETRGSGIGVAKTNREVAGMPTTREKRSFEKCMDAGDSKRMNEVVRSRFGELERKLIDTAQSCTTWPLNMQRDILLNKKRRSDRASIIGNVFAKQGNNSYADQSRGVAPPKKFLSTSIRTLAEKRSSIAQDGQGRKMRYYEGWLDNIANFEKHVTLGAKMGQCNFEKMTEEPKLDVLNSVIITELTSSDSSGRPSYLSSRVPQSSGFTRGGGRGGRAVCNLQLLVRKRADKGVQVRAADRVENNSESFASFPESFSQLTPRALILGQSHRDATYQRGPLTRIFVSAAVQTTVVQIAQQQLKRDIFSDPPS